MARRDVQRELYAELDARGLLEYGSVIESSVVHAALGIDMPTVASKSEFDRLALIELSAIDYVRNILLGQGKYLTGTDAGYRILLPSENSAQVEQYISSADKKLTRALKLFRNSPSVNSSLPDQTEARILMKRAGMKNHNANL